MAVEGLSKTFDHRKEPVPAVRDVSLAVRQGELLVVVGPSGSGKSTLLRCIAGLESADAGRIYVGGNDVTRAPARDRDLAMVFQDYALYPHMDVRRNIGFPLEARKAPKAEVAAKVGEAAEMLGISGLLDRRPGELSGGERRRVSLARAVVRTPAAFLMDEPLANLDTGLRHRVLDSIRALQRELGTTTLYITHDQTEAMTLGTRIAILREGRLEQVGAPLDLYDRPKNSFVATFLGREPMNLWRAEGAAAAGGAAQVGARAEHLRLVGAAEGIWAGAVTAVDQLGPDVLLTVVVRDRPILVRAGRAGHPKVGDEVGLAVEDRHLHRFAPDGSAL